MNSKTKSDMTNPHYDIIGDIHGHYAPLARLLETLGYRQQEGVYQHARRKAIFLGDFIDRGPEQKQVLNTVRRMVDAGQALAVMGNHELNAIGYATPRPEQPGEWLRPHSEKNTHQHRAFLDAFPDEAERREWIDWFLTLPLWLDLGGLRVVHACWDERAQEVLKPCLNRHNQIVSECLPALFAEGTPVYEALETLLKGKEVRLPAGQVFHDKDGHERNCIRIRWWDAGATTYRSAFLGPERVATHIPDEPLGVEHLIEYGHQAPPVCFGHYWMEGTPAPLAANVACLDWSVAKPGGRLVAYRWDGERQFKPDKFIEVKRDDT